MDQILLVDHKKSALWLPPGGHVQLGEDPKETVKREASEELGIEAEFIYDKPLFITVKKTVGNILQHTDVSLWYQIKLDPNCSLNFNRSEFNQIKWFYLDEISFYHSDQHMKRFIQKMTSRFSSENKAATSI